MYLKKKSFVSFLFLEIDYCVGQNCNDGVCIDSFDGYRCDCFKGFTGEHCEIGLYSTLSFLLVY